MFEDLILTLAIIQSAYKRFPAQMLPIISLTWIRNAECSPEVGKTVDV